MWSTRDDHELMARVPGDRPSISFGLSEGADVRLLHASLSVSGTQIRVAIEGVGEVEARLQLIGYAAAIDACAALACVLSVAGANALARAVRGPVAGGAHARPDGSAFPGAMEW